MWSFEAENGKATLVIVHGAQEHYGRYKWLIEKWCSNGFNVVMGDLPGQGTSKKRKIGHIESFDDYIEEIEIWYREAMKFKRPIFILGHSMGGLATIRTLQEINLPVAGVILSSPCLGILQGPNKALNAATALLNKMTPSMLFPSELDIELVTRSEEVREQSRNDSMYVTKVSVRWYRELVKAMKNAVEQLDNFPDVPILIMQAGNDKIVDKRFVRNWMNKLDVTDKTYKEWRGLYHEIFNEPEQEDVFLYALHFVHTQLSLA